jgi:integrase
VNFLSWLEFSGKGHNAEKAWTAIKARWKDQGIVKDNIDPRIQSIPFIVDILFHHMSSEVKDKIWIRDACIVTIGFRAMRRANELCNLKASDIRLEEDKVVVCIRKSKTDQLRKGKKIPIDKTGELTCPVKIVSDYVKCWNIDLTSEEIFFKSARKSENKGVSVSAISSVVKRMAAKAGIVGKFSSHSLRIGGASAAIKGGMSMEQVKAIGGWISEYINLWYSLMIEVTWSFYKLYFPFCPT